MEKRNIIVIGASAGGFDAIKKLTAVLPPDLDAAIFIVWHMSADIRGIMPDVINRANTIHAVTATDNEPLAFNRIYVAAPDRHLLLEKDRIRVTRGPKENRFRPAIDPLFRSAAFAYNSRVIGVILSGALDDGTAGLWTVKNRGGIAIVQDPLDAEVASMPENALRAVNVDHRVAIADMAPLLVKLCQEQAAPVKNITTEENKKTNIEVRIAAEEEALEQGVLGLGELTPYACPECHGVLSRLRDGDLIRYRCHTGHAYSTDSLLASLTENIEESLWGAIRGVEESIILLNHLGDHFAEINQPQTASLYFKKANDALMRAKLVRQAVLAHEQLTTDSINKEAKQAPGQEKNVNV